MCVNWANLSFVTYIQDVIFIILGLTLQRRVHAMITFETYKSHYWSDSKSTNNNLTPFDDK